VDYQRQRVGVGFSRRGRTEFGFSEAWTCAFGARAG